MSFIHTNFDCCTQKFTKSSSYDVNKPVGTTEVSFGTIFVGVV
jgi:hypothetical protein